VFLNCAALFDIGVLCDTRRRFPAAVFSWVGWACAASRDWADACYVTLLSEFLIATALLDYLG